MAPKVVRFVSREDRLTRSAAEAMREQFLLFPASALSPATREEVLNALARLALPDTEQQVWPGGFAMWSRVQMAAVWDAVRALPPQDRPHLVRHALDLVLLNLRHDTGEVMLKRAEFAAAMGCGPEHVSRVMATLERMGVIRRERRATEGVRGRGNVVYFINPHVAWNGSLSIRREEAAASSPPLLALVHNSAKSSK